MFGFRDREIENQGEGKWEIVYEISEFLADLVRPRESCQLVAGITLVLVCPHSFLAETTQTKNQIKEHELGFVRSFVHIK